jgi:hypothetical protein
MPWTTAMMATEMPAASGGAALVGNEFGEDVLHGALVPVVRLSGSAPCADNL